MVNGVRMRRQPSGHIRAVGRSDHAADQAGDGTFASQHVAVDVVITKSTQSITFDELADKLVSDAPFSLTASATSNKAVTFSTQSTACTVTGTEVSITAVGECAIDADQEGDLTWAAADTVTRTFAITGVKPRAPQDWPAPRQEYLPSNGCRTP